MIHDRQCERFSTYKDEVETMLAGGNSISALSCNPSVTVGVLPVARMEIAIEDPALAVR
jgi:hypothetical protein